MKSAEGKKLVVLGAGESGVGAALLAKAKGYEVLVSDGGTLKPIYKEKLEKAGIRFEERTHSMADILAADEVVKSPGIPEKAEVMQAIRAQGIPVISEIDLASRYTKAQSIAITGTNGKTTTTLLTYHLLKEAGFNVGLAGNVGYSFAEQVLADEHDWYVLELSSFQLDDTHDYTPTVAVLLNITPDHLDRYHYSLEEYAQAKLRITRNLDSSCYFIYNADDEVIQREYQSVFVDTNDLPFSLHQRPDVRSAALYRSETQLRLDIPQLLDEPEQVNISNSPLIGQHNRQNLAAAILAARVAGVSVAQIEAALPTFQNADHRLQPVGDIGGVRFINDSKATNVEAAWYALDGVKAPIVWIAGGTDKGNDYTSLQPLAERKVKALICLGVDNAKLRAAFAEKVPHLEETQSVVEAVRRAHELAAPGDVVLLSPACASFDLFKNYEDRGRQFAAAVRELAQEKSPSS
ncbi:UDP-N-acetylmuramoyl-L-alanine--D-glutamate ligase [Hymenobacter busanensis]|uniref:UDP-N-acetylmuramoylalanine--D-glutamate ligase n=1 Tax=Hymenobacter busanensis TaxID=2607656 RepID=A0A7L4ZUI7_9BACT|nr:UDP-N-acetylmuramoyl-L-alanine--D-glutamate ligase [Hymenobacter busanensis]KAA9339109.1 UDP-N-acetylmuramoyl-L-alanine--D-glutamate ligase [Hymenobacter busanensis]QHJ07129.1 UDP-N-acetylmuramoyl-L-alanine--D-glutamate ligase [Hymenobacter busanensis]